MMNSCKENVTRLIPIPKSPVVKPPIYRSMYTDSIKKTFKINKDCHRTMGHAQIHLNPPSVFLKKHTRKTIKPLVEFTRLCQPKEIKVNKFRKTNLNENEKKKKDYKRINILETVQKIPPLIRHKVQDTRNGHVILLDKAGLEPMYVLKKSFGKTPDYIFKLNKEKGKTRIIQDEQKKTVEPILRCLPEQERSDLLKGLKTNWSQLQEEFQLLPMITDTLPKMKKKTILEKQLKDLEKDIDLLERSPFLYVCSDNDDDDDEENYEQ
ncbi:enkurin-like isoform X2 [Daktulosphaira vitifoliae]|uniref:enkurin-like isoform X2 n=1 Tax=Daktulosphaira vitifoliae TaxID=58002 RepID=UPI0021AA2438|nr:enkurin-like isoform X2 [Daktulosphaira vitifoliae]